VIPKMGVVRVVKDTIVFECLGAALLIDAEGDWWRLFSTGHGGLVVRNTQCLGQVNLSRARERERQTLSRSSRGRLGNRVNFASTSIGLTLDSGSLSTDIIGALDSWTGRSSASEEN
jgi:hypothetical protein